MRVCAWKPGHERTLRGTARFVQRYRGYVSVRFHVLMETPDRASHKCDCTHVVEQTVIPHMHTRLETGRDDLLDIFHDYQENMELVERHRVSMFVSVVSKEGEVGMNWRDTDR